MGFVEDDPIIALDFEDTFLGFGVKTVRENRVDPIPAISGDEDERNFQRCEPGCDLKTLFPARQWKFFSSDPPSAWWINRPC